MGCAASADGRADSKPRNVNGNGKDEKSRAEKYADTATPLGSEAQGLYDELDQRTPSKHSDAAEPSNAVRSMRFQAIVTRGKLVNGVNDDPEQYAHLIEDPEFKRRDRRRVEEWQQLVSAATGPAGPAAIPAGFYLVTATDTTSSAARKLRADSTVVSHFAAMDGSGIHQNPCSIDDSTTSASHQNDSLCAESGRLDLDVSAREAIRQHQQRALQQQQHQQPTDGGGENSSDHHHVPSDTKEHSRSGEHERPQQASRGDDLVSV